MPTKREREYSRIVEKHYANKRLTKTEKEFMREWFIDELGEVGSRVKNLRVRFITISRMLEK